eukprot:CAMPEP_0119406920 /NCGR_PEP_ID=MMETSP1335-20130426/1056_1 /TAXON_ID=259385 /ORGANISM="Chrysoculter rhomboideus, Strain RCC1486" /LENGTH=129 /DNA_ID=CAMNT_0007431013 /DNA_START=486 /DNA_END=871 /DNA_ORIENTATION=-
MPCCYAARLDSAGVEHHAHTAADRLRRQVLAELRTHHATVAVWPAHLTPDHTETRAIDLALRLVDVREALAQVEVDCAALVHAIDFDERRVVRLVLLRPLVAEDGALAPQPHGLSLLRVDAHASLSQPR